MARAIYSHKGLLEAILFRRTKLSLLQRLTQVESVDGSAGSERLGTPTGGVVVPGHPPD